MASSSQSDNELTLFPVHTSTNAVLLYTRTQVLFLRWFPVRPLLVHKHPVPTGSSQCPWCFPAMSHSALCLGRSPVTLEGLQHREGKPVCAGMTVRLAANYPTTLWAKTITFYCLSCFWGLTGLSRKFLAQGLSCNCSQVLAGTGIIRRPPLTHVSGVWTQMAGTSGHWSGPSMGSLWPPLSMADSEECRTSHVAGFPQNMYPKRLGRKL